MIRAIRMMQRKKALSILAIIIASAAIVAFLCLRFEGAIIKSYLLYFVEDKVSKALGVHVTMESIKPGIWGPTVLKGFGVVKAVSGSDAPFIFKSDKLIIYNNIARMAVDKLIKKTRFGSVNLVFKIENGFLYKGKKPIFENINGYGKIVDNNLLFDDISGKCYGFPLSVHGNVSGKTSKAEMDIKSVSNRLKARVQVSNLILNPDVRGELVFNNNSRFSFSGKADFVKKKFYAQIYCLSSGLTELPALQTPKKDIIQLVGDFSDQGSLKGGIFFNHVGIGRLDLQSELDYEIVFAYNRLSGKIKTGGTILDYRPFKELEGEFSVEDKILRIPGLKLGDDYNLNGFINLYKPYELNLALDIKDSNLSQLLLMSDAESEGNIGGRITGFIRTEGPLENLITTAKLKCGKGHLGNLDYESMNINLRGNGPVLKVSDSRILRKQGYIELSGEVDLKRLWSTEPYKGLAWTSGNEAIVWNGWNIMKETNSKEVEMKKGVGREKEFMVTFKGYLNDEQSWQDTQGHKQDEAVGVEYKLDDAKRVKMQLKKNGEAFSLEHKVKF